MEANEHSTQALLTIILNKIKDLETQVFNMQVRQDHIFECKQSKITM